MQIEKTQIDGVLIIKPKVYSDYRGWFTETYNKKEFMNSGVSLNFIQDNHSFSKEKGTLRGIHFQTKPMAQTKLIRCVKGEILDVAVDLRKTSKTYKKWLAVNLSAENFLQLLIPKGFGHAFLTLTENVEVMYKVDKLYSPNHEHSIIYNDPELNITWPELKVILSEKDKTAPLLKEVDIEF